MNYALDQFTMRDGEVLIVQGANSLYTYQNTGNSSALIQGSNDTSHWADIAQIAVGNSSVKEHSYKYLRSLGNTTVAVNRGEGDNTIGSVGSVNGQTGVVVLDADDVGATTQAYVDTRDSLLQAQINNINSSVKTMVINTQSSTNYTLALTDAGNCVEMHNASANTLTIPPNSTIAYSVGTTILIRQMGTGQTTLVAGSGVTIRNPHGTLKLLKQYAAVALHKRATDEWCIEGNLAEF